MISLLLTLLIMVVCFYYGVMYRDPGILTVLFALGILAVLSLIELVFRRFTFRCYANIPIAMAEKGRPIELLIETKNSGWLPVGKVKVKLSVINVLKKEKEQVWLTLPGAPVGRKKYAFPLEVDSAGAYDVRIEKVRVYGLTAFIFMNKKSKERASFCILPEIHSMNLDVEDSTRNFRGDADIFDDFRCGDDPTETFDIREYREKDKLQNIHWKLSARTDELMVKENSLPRPCAVVLMPDTAGRGKVKAEADAFLELFASISFRLMDLKCPHFVAWLSRETGDVRRIRVDNEESYYMCLNYFLRDIDGETGKSVRQEYRERFKNEIYLHDVVITRDLKLFKDEELITKWNVKEIKSIEDECDKLELLL